MHAALQHKIPVPAVLAGDVEVRADGAHAGRRGAHRLVASIKRGFLEYADWKNKIHPASGRLAAAPILIDDSSAISIMEIRAKARRFRGDPTLLPAAAARHRRPPAAAAAGPDRRRLPAARARRRQPARRQPPAGDRRHLARAEGAGQGSEGADHRHLAAEPRGREARGQAAPVRPARIGQHRAGRRHGPLHPPRGHGRAATRPTAPRRRRSPRSSSASTATAAPAR